MRRSQAYAALATAGCLLAAGCGLRPPQGVHVPGPVRADAGGPGDVRVLPPGPRPGSGPVAVVEGFLGAQSAPEDGHGLARQFLAPNALWDDTAGLQVYAPQTLDVAMAPGERATVVVTARTTGSILRDGTYDGTGQALKETYRLVRRAGAWQLAEVPQGLRLTPADQVRSYRPYAVYFVADPPDRVPTTSTHLVADQVFLPVGPPPAEALVRRLVQGPSGELAGQVQSALPAGARLRVPVSAQDGTVTVDLDAGVQALDDAARARLSAQLVWTLRGAGTGFQRLRLLAGGRTLEVRGHVGDQQRTDWADFDPDGLPPKATAYAVVGRTLRALDGGTGAAPAGRPAGLEPPVPVDDAAVSPGGSQVALLTATALGVEVRTGASRGPFVLRARQPGVSSPSWGSGEDGLWLLRAGRPVLLRVRGRRAAPGPVPIDGIDVPAVATEMRVSRDGARVALVSGGRLYVGRVERAGGLLRLGGLRRIASSLTRVSAVDWQSDTLLVVLARVGRQGPLPVRVAVDGSSVVPVARAGLVGTPTSLAAAPDRPLAIATVEAGVHRLFRDDGRFFQPVGSGSDPFYPG